MKSNLILDLSKALSFVGELHRFFLYKSVILTFFGFDRNALKKKFHIVIRYSFELNMLSESLFDFSKCFNLKMHTIESTFQDKELMEVEK